MIVFWVLIACAAGMTLAQIAVPGSAVFHTGWYNAIDIAALIIAASQLRSASASAAGRVQSLAIVTFGCAVVVIAGAGSGLMAPDTHTIVGAPGAGVRDPDANGTFVFPLQGNDVHFERGGSASTIDGGRRYTANFAFWQQPRTVVNVQAADANGNHLTITQPTNASFLSPVLLMQQTTTIAGMDVSYDTFSVPAASRSVRAVLFTPQQAAQLRSSAIVPGQAAILFAVSDLHDRSIPNGIAVTAPGVPRAIGGLQLSGTVGSYPAIVVASIPYLPVTALGIIVLIFGAIRWRLR